MRTRLAAYREAIYNTMMIRGNVQLMREELPVPTKSESVQHVAGTRVEPAPSPLEWTENLEQALLRDWKTAHHALESGELEAELTRR